MANNKKKIVMGLGVTGQALIEFFIKRHIPCVGFEELSKENHEACLKKFGDRGVQLYFEILPLEAFDNCDEFLVSPGVPLTRSWVQEAKKREIPVVGELEFASCFLKGDVLGVTGTNGKSTTVSILHHILKEGGFKSSLKGNIGQPLITAVAEPPQDFYVVEASSYQLETIVHFHPKVAVVLNVTEDHLDRYSGFSSYTAAKARMMENQTEKDFFIYNADDRHCVQMAKGARAKRYPFSLVNHQKEGAFVDRNEMIFRLGDCERRFPLETSSLKGLHNQENMLASVMSALCVGVSSDAITGGLKKFKSLPHRLEKIGTWRGIEFYDDSKGTNVGSVVMSLASFEGNVILILGGRDKGGDYSPLKPLIRHKTRGVIVMGEAREKILSGLGGEKNIYTASNMKEAVALSYEMGKPGDVVLLSPACSSFDQYKNYAERGNDFKKWAEVFGRNASMGQAL